MAIPQAGSILHHLRQAMLRRDGAGLTDGQLLRSYLVRGDEAAFEALVRRHGPMVYGVCCRVLHNPDDADDAFQAVFLVLLRKATTLATREVVGDWLHGVAYRTALKARAAAARRQVQERRTARSEAVLDEETRPDWLPLLDREIERLPSKYRLPVLLCDMQGHTRKEAARQLGWPEGTVSGRLSRARALLARRLTRCGVTLSAAVAALALTDKLSAHVPLSLIGSTCKAASGFAARCAAGSVSAPVAALTEGVVKAMLLSKVKNGVAVAMVALALAASISAWRYSAVAGQTGEPREEKSAPATREIPKRDEPRERAQIPQIPAAKRSFRIDLLVAREKEGQRKALAYPRLIALEGKEARFRSGPSYLYTFGAMNFVPFSMGPTVSVKVYEDKSKLCLDMTVTQPTLGIFEQDATVESKSIQILRRLDLGQPITAKLRTSDKDKSFLVVTAAVQEAEKDLDANAFPTPGYGSYTDSKSNAAAENSLDAKTVAAAEKELHVAEFLRRTNNPGSSYFYYELLTRRYPGTLYAERAKERMAEMDKLRKQPEKSKEKQPMRVGQVFIEGNKTISDDKILEHACFFPGMRLTFADLRDAERNLSKLKGLKRNPTVTILDSEGKSEFKDIRISVEEE
jgi:RNA polymerase sigma factor (sigma-70 family)